MNSLRAVFKIKFFIIRYTIVKKKIFCPIHFPWNFNIYISRFVDIYTSSGCFRFLSPCCLLERLILIAHQIWKKNNDDNTHYNSNQTARAIYETLCRILSSNKEKTVNLFNRCLLSVKMTIICSKISSIHNLLNYSILINTSGFERCSFKSM